MKLQSASTILMAVCALWMTGSSSAQNPSAGSGPYHLSKTEKMGGAGTFDYVYADSVGRRLYVPRATRVTVFDLDSLAPQGEIANTPGARGVAVDPASKHGFSSSNPVAMWDTENLKRIKDIPVQGRPDGISYEPFTKRIYVFSHTAPNVTIIDPADGSIVKTMDLGGAPEQAQSDNAGHMYVDLEDKDSIGVVDTKAMALTGTYPLGEKGGAPAGLGFDIKNHILFAFCADQQSCVILNSTDGKIISTLPIGRGVDGGGFNPATMEAFSSQGDGTITIIKENSPSAFSVEQTVMTKPGAKTITLDTKTNSLYSITAEYGPPAARRGGAAGGTTTTSATTAGRGRRGGRGTMVDGSFSILKIDRSK